jgi:hypothetical protein
LLGLVAAAAPQFVNPGVQKYGSGALGREQPGIVFLRERSAAKGHNFFSAGSQLAEQIPQSRMFGAAEFRFTRIAENLSYRAPLPPFDAIVEILEGPAQPFAEDATHTALARPHEANQNYGLQLPGSGRRREFGDTATRRFARLPGMPLTPIRFALGFRYCFSERFLR